MDTFRQFVKNIEEVKCFICEHVHNGNDESFISIYGDVHIGRLGGVIGHSFDKELKLTRGLYLCRKWECFKKGFYIEDMFGDELAKCTIKELLELDKQKV